VTDAALVARAREGDAGAFAELVDRHRTAVYRAALAALGSHADAEDAAQEAFISAFNRLGTFKGDASFKTWLLTIAWHHAMNRRRSVRRWLRRLVQIGTGEDAYDTTRASPTAEGAVFDTPEQRASDNELRRDIRREIRALSPKLRDALLLAHTGEHSYEEMAAMLKAPVGTVKWRVSEARRVIRARLRTRGYSHAG
jgi:RNA polymerase sigma-70 factor (ECF subfamily)